MRMPADCGLNLKDLLHEGFVALDLEKPSLDQFLGVYVHTVNASTVYACLIATNCYVYRLHLSSLKDLEISFFLAWYSN